MVLVRRCLALLAVFSTSPAWGDPQVALETVTKRGRHYIAALEGGGIAELTLSPSLQPAVEQLLAGTEAPFAAAVAISIPDGRVLAMAGRSTLDPSIGAAELALRAWAPAASVFKVVAAAALVQEAGLSAGSRACYHGGISAVLADNLVDIPRLDRRCDTLAYAVGKSQNAIIAKLASRHLRPEALRRVAGRFGFGEALPFEAPLEVSEVDVPDDRLEFARAAAGFWHSSLSPMHGALLAAAVANAGQMPSPRLIETAIGVDGMAITIPRRPARRVVDARAALVVSRMMALTTRMGTAKGSFHDRRGHAFLPIDVAGKTGTLSYRGSPGDPQPPAAILPDGGYLGYSWFVGFAPAQKPRVAFAVVLGNQAGRRLRAALVARHLVAQYLVTEHDSHASRVVASR